MKKLGLIFLTVFIVASSCCNKEEKKTGTFKKFFNNGETEGSWLNTNTLKEGPAFSGTKSAQVDSLTEYGFGFRDTLKNVGDNIPLKISANAMIMRPTEIDDATLVVSVDRGDKNLLWQGTSLKGFAPKPNEWSKLSVQYNLPKDLQATDKIAVYLWNKDKRKIYMDNFEVLFE
ncbi:MAG: hypothetical protein WCK02_01090 [Bacteroidota bacterium]